MDVTKHNLKERVKVKSDRILTPRFDANVQTLKHYNTDIRAFLSGEKPYKEPPAPTIQGAVRDMLILEDIEDEDILKLAGRGK